MSPTEKLKGAFAGALMVSPGTDFESFAYGKTDGWDSVSHMALVAEIEVAFEIMLDTDDVISLSSFLEAKKILAKYGVNFV